MSRGFDKEEEKWRIRFRTASSAESKKCLLMELLRRIMNTRHGVTFPVSGNYVAVYFRGLSVLPGGMITWQTGKMIRGIDLIRDTAEYVVTGSSIRAATRARATSAPRRRDGNPSA